MEGKQASNLTIE